ncbi:MAG TPA: YggS family pyridoxal phosphate-dependent enzyme [Thermoanaerobaculia bacterium]|nr:YggS family pyridoxal phosphate-dependent enzyme [Thermoanaerobaculia bacterium]
MSGAPLAEITRRRAEILETIARAAARAARRPEDVALMAVTKGQNLETVRRAAAAGLTLFGENRVQEGSAKVEALGTEFPGVSWRLIGPLQTNKAKSALQWFAAVESLDRERLAMRLEALLGEAPGARVLPVLIEVNVGGEASKSGVEPGQVSRLMEVALGCPHLAVRGLMAVPPYDEDPEKSRPHFRRLAELRERLAGEFRRPLPELSMGMSHDFAVAVEEGATEVRVGTALFGPREAA